MQTESMEDMIVRAGRYRGTLYFLSHSMFDNVAQFVKQQKLNGICV